MPCRAGRGNARRRWASSQRQTRRPLAPGEAGLAGLAALKLASIGSPRLSRQGLALLASRSSAAPCSPTGRRCHCPRPSSALLGGCPAFRPPPPSPVRLLRCSLPADGAFAGGRSRLVPAGGAGDFSATLADSPGQATPAPHPSTLADGPATRPRSLQPGRQPLHRSSIRPAPPRPSPSASPPPPPPSSPVPPPHPA